MPYKLWPSHRRPSGASTGRRQTIAAPHDAEPATAGPAKLSARWRIRAPLLLFGAGLGLSGCITALPPLPPAETAYRLGPGDRIRVITFGEQQLTGEFRVSDSGDIALPELGTIHATGLTAHQLARHIAAALRAAKLFTNPSVSVEVIAYRPIFVLGEVNHPGQYPYQPGMTVVTAVAIAGGFTYRAIEDKFSVVRTVDNHTVEGRAFRGTRLEPGDVLTVLERVF